MYRIVFSILICSALALPSFCSAQNNAEATATPEGVVRAYFEGMEEDRIDDLVALMHPSALLQFKGAMMMVLDSAVKYNEEEMVLTWFPGITGVDSLRALDPTQVYAGFMKGIIARDGTLGFGADRPKVLVIGHVKEGEDSAHVVYRLDTQSGEYKNSELSTFLVLRNGNRWGLMLAREISGLEAIWQMREGVMNDE